MVSISPKSPTEIPSNSPASATESIVESSISSPNSQGTATFETSSSLPPDITAQMDEIETQVVTLGELQSSVPTKFVSVSFSALCQSIINDILEEYFTEDTQDEPLILSTSGLYEPDLVL